MLINHVRTLINGTRKIAPQLKLVAVAAVSVLTGSLVAAAPAHAAVSNWQKGISIQSRWNTDFASDTFKQSVQKAKGDGINAIMLIVPVHQDNIYSSNVYPGNDTPTDSALASGLSYIKSQGISAGIAIHDNPNDGQWRAMINPGDTVTWFNNYGSLLTRYAGIAQSSGASQMIIGTELSTMTRSQNTSNWVNLINAIRGKFSGSLTYSAQHAGYMGDVNQVGFWGSLDYVGISAYYSLYGRTDQAGMESAWKDWDTSEISAIAAKTNKKVLFTEVGFVSRDGTTNDPGSAYTLGTNINAGLQANAYSALFNYGNSASSLAGAYLWDWSSDPNAGGGNDGGYTPQNKPAEAVIKQWFGGQTPSGSGGNTGGGTTTPVQPALTIYTATLNAATTAVVGAQAPATLSLSGNGTAPNMIVDIEIYNSTGTRVVQTVYTNQTVSQTPQAYALNWTPASSGTYTVKAGVFTANWAGNPYWNNSVGSIAVSPVSAPTTPVVPPAGTTPGMGGGTVPTTPPSTTPSTPAVPTTPTVLPTDINIWWPGSGVTVSGVQPFKAVIDGRDSGTYDLYWQVDNGTLNKLGDKADPIVHKESSVDLTGWNWNPSHKYVINFVAKDKSGTVLSQKAVTITIY